jgi:hypothetical protein
LPSSAVWAVRVVKQTKGRNEKKRIELFKDVLGCKHVVVNIAELSRLDGYYCAQ